MQRTRFHPTLEEALGDPGVILPAGRKQDSSPCVTFYPDAIPADRTLVLAASGTTGVRADRTARDAGHDGPSASARVRRQIFELQTA